ncbi:MAG: cobaltochelatase CobT-related protein, partial [Xanthobacteraceae bacterium]
TLLIDNSGSMRGEKITSLARSALFLVQLLDELGIRTEVLGYTTRSWKGGKAKELWLSDGKPAAPGRLNDLRHLIYKTFDEAASMASQRLGAMLHESLLKEDIDGEALLWAYERLVLERSTTKILFMFSDGMPVDESTSSLHDKGFLEDHFISVVKQIVAAKAVSLKLLGIDYDFSRVLADAVAIKGNVTPAYAALTAIRGAIDQMVINS